MHGDIRLQNFVLGQSHGADTVMVIDLARTSPGASEEMRAQEAQELERLLLEHLESTEVVAEGQRYNTTYDPVMVQ